MQEKLEKSFYLKNKQGLNSRKLAFFYLLPCMYIPTTTVTYVILYTLCQPLCPELVIFVHKLFDICAI